MGTMVAFVGYMERVYSPLRRLINSSTQLTQSIASIDRVFELMNESYDIVDKSGAEPLKNVKGKIDIEDISFRYEKTEPEVLKNVSLNVERSEEHTSELQSRGHLVCRLLL